MIRGTTVPVGEFLYERISYYNRLYFRCWPMFSWFPSEIFLDTFCTLHICKWVLCKMNIEDAFQCISSHEVVFSVITWAGHLNSMLNPFIYSRFSREFRRAFKQILTCERERRIKTAIRTPLGIVFAQLVSVTQLWEQPNECTSSAAID